METQTQNRLVDTIGGKRRWGEPKEQHAKIHMTIRKIESQGEFAV